MSISRHRYAAAISWALASSAMAWGQTPTPERQKDTGSALLIDEVSIAPRQLRALGDEKVTIAFKLSGPARALVRILDAQKNVLRTIDLGQLDAGAHMAVWDGRDDKGQVCQGAQFLCTIHARDKQRNRAVYDPLGRGVGLEIRPEKFAFDNKTGRLSYVLPRPAKVRIRIGLKDGPLMRTLVDWEAQSAGAHELTWDGKDASGAMQLLNHPTLDVKLSAYAVLPNCIWVQEVAAAAQAEKAAPTPSGVGRPGMAGRGPYLHSFCDPGHCHEPRFTVTLQGAQDSGQGGTAVSGKTAVRVEIERADWDYLVSKRFEVIFYVDGVFIFEEESGTTPLTYYWDTARLAPGKHPLTVNVMSYDDHVGTVTKVVNVGGAK